MLLCLSAVEDDSLFDKVNKWPTLFATGCYCDVYSPWSYDAYISIAQRWLSVDPAIVILSVAQILMLISLKKQKNYRRLMLCRYRYWYRFSKMLLVFIFIKIYVCVYTIDVFCELLERILARFPCRGTMWVHYWLLLQMSLPWDEETRSDHISVVAAAMSYMHLSAAAETKKQFRSQTVPHQRLFSPSAFADFISCFGMFARKRQQFQLVTDKIHLLFISSAFVAFIS